MLNQTEGIALTAKLGIAGAAVGLSVLAEVADPSLTPLAGAGAIGAVLWYVLSKLEPRMRAIEEAIDRLSRAYTLSVLDHNEDGQANRQEARRLLAEIPKPREG